MFCRSESIELVELDLEPLLESCCMLKSRIRLGFTGFFEVIWVVLGNFRGDDGD